MYTRALARNSTLFNIHLAKINKPLLVLEGILDAFHAKSKGIYNVVALGGTKMGIRQVELLSTLKAKELILCLNNDKAGSEATTQIALLLHEKLPQVSLKQVT
jgi:DNA primase